MRSFSNLVYIPNASIISQIIKQTRKGSIPRDNINLTMLQRANRLGSRLGMVLWSYWIQPDQVGLRIAVGFTFTAAYPLSCHFSSDLSSFGRA